MIQLNSHKLGQFWGRSKDKSWIARSTFLASLTFFGASILVHADGHKQANLVASTGGAQALSIQPSSMPGASPSAPLGSVVTYDAI
jgi:hypothetical protein